MICFKNEGELKIACFNANSLLSHFDLLTAHLDTCFYHVMAITETWLHPLIPDEPVKIDDYLLIRNDRKCKKGGGVAFYIHSSFHVKVLEFSSNVFLNAPEFIALELKCPQGDTLLLIVMYRRPKGFLFNEFSNTLSKYSFAY